MRNSGTLEGFGSGPVAMTVLKNAIPAILAMLMVLVYNLADTFFIGQTHNAYQVAAVSLATPVFLTFMALGTVFGVGGTSVISRALGEKRMDYALKVSAFCMWSCVAVGIVVAVLFYLFMDELLLLIGASTETWELTRDYLNIVTLCGPFVLIGNCFSNILRAEGQPTRAMTGMVAGNLLNVVLDPVMILGFGWGVTGAAIATVIGNLAGAAYYILYFLRGNSNPSIGLSEFTAGEGVCRSVLGIGIPASLGSLLMSVSQIVTNSLMSGYSDMAIAGIGVAMKVTMMIGMVSIGLGQGIQPLLGYCIGAKNWERYSGILRFSLLLSLVLGGTLTGVCYLFTDAIVSAFLTQPEALEYSVQFGPDPAFNQFPVRDFLLPYQCASGDGGSGRFVPHQHQPPGPDLHPRAFPAQAAYGCERTGLGTAGRGLALSAACRRSLWGFVHQAEAGECGFTGDDSSSRQYLNGKAAAVACPASLAWDEQKGVCRIRKVLQTPFLNQSGAGCCFPGTAN